MNKLHGAIVLVVWVSVFLAIADHAHGQSRRWRIRAARTFTPPPRCPTLGAHAGLRESQVSLRVASVVLLPQIHGCLPRSVLR